MMILVLGLKRIFYYYIYGTEIFAKNVDKQGSALYNQLANRKKVLFFEQKCVEIANEKGLNAMRDKITLACTECKQRNYDTKKNKKNDPDRIEMKKYCKFCKKHTDHKETK